MKSGQFVMTRSNLVAEVLKKSGYTLLYDQNDTWTFLNNGKHNFSEEERKHTVITNKMFM